MIKRIFLAALASMAITGFVMAHGTTLWEHFEGVLPEKSERALMYYDYDGDEKYSGTKEQNILLLNNLHSTFGALAFPPSTVEGTSTAGWTDDGSIVRLNTAADSVGIGTANPSEKLTVQGGNFFLSGNLLMSGGTINFGSSSGTSTLSTVSGNLGVGTTTPRALFAVQGTSFLAGTTTVGGLISTSTIISQGTGTSTMSGGLDVSTGCFAINGTCVAAGGGGSVFLASSNGAAVGTASTTLVNVNISASAFATGEVIRVTAQATSSGASGAGGALYQHLSLSLGGNATTTCGIQTNAGGATTTYTFIIRANSSTAQSLSCNSTFVSSGTNVKYKNNNYELSNTGGAPAETDYSLAQGTATLTNAQNLLFVLGRVDEVQNGLRGGTVFGITAELLNL